MVAQGSEDPRGKKTPMLLEILVSLLSFAIDQSYPRVKEWENKLYFVMGEASINLKPHLITSRPCEWKSPIESFVSGELKEVRGRKKVCLVHSPP